MKKIFLIIITVIIFISLFTFYSNQKESKNAIEANIKEVVWEQLNSINKERTQGTWQFGSVSKVVPSSNYLFDKTYVGKKVYLIHFPTKDTSYPTNIEVYASLDNYKIIGCRLLD